MYRDKTIAVIVPAYNEEKLIGKVLKTTPEFVDHIIVVDDASSIGPGRLSKAVSYPASRFREFFHWGRRNFRGFSEYTFWSGRNRAKGEKI